MPEDQEPFGTPAQGERRAPEQIAAEAIARTVCAKQPVAGPKDCGAPCSGCLGAGRDAVEAMSAAGLVIVPAWKMAALLELERFVGEIADAEE